MLFRSCAISFPIYCVFSFHYHEELLFKFFHVFCLSTIIFFIMEYEFFRVRYFLSYTLFSPMPSISFSLCLFICDYFFLPNYYILLIYFILLSDKSISFPINLPAYFFWDFIALLHHHLPPSASIYFSTLLSCYLSFCQFLFSFLVGCLWPAWLFSKYLNTFFSQYHLSNLHSTKLEDNNDLKVDAQKKVEPITIGELLNKNIKRKKSLRTLCSQYIKSYFFH